LTGLTDDAVRQEGKAPVARKIQTLFIDDLDGSEAEATVRFALDGTEYEIDLNAEHVQALRDALARYVRAPAGGPDSTEVREWPRRRASRSRTAAGYPLKWSPDSRPSPDSRVRVRPYLSERQTDQDLRDLCRRYPVTGGKAKAQDDIPPSASSAGHGPDRATVLGLSHRSGAPEPTARRRSRSPDHRYLAGLSPVPAASRCTG
jgi:hypothetical protein